MFEYQHALSVIIPTRDAASVRPQVAALAAGGVSDIVVVHPGAPVDLSPARSCATGALLSPAMARNHGVKQTTRPYLCFLDDDVNVSATVLLQLAHTCAQPGVVAAAPILDDAPTDGYWRRALHRTIAAGHRTARNRDTTDAFTTMCLCMPRDVFAAVGGFDSGFMNPAGEDTALVRRLSAHGTLVRSADVSMTHHPHPDGWWAATRRVYGYGAAWPQVDPSARAAVLARWCSTPLRRAAAAPLCVWFAAVDALRTSPGRFLPGVWWLRWCWFLGVIGGRDV